MIEGRSRFLSGREFEAALAVLEERGINESELLHRLGLESRNSNQARRWCAIGAPKYIALAITAILEDRPAWKPEKRKKK